MKSDLLRIHIEVDADWLAYNIYRMALERIAKEADAQPWAFTGEEAGEIARRILEEFPGSAKK